MGRASSEFDATNLSQGAASPLFRNRDYASLWVGQTLSLIGSQTAWIAYPLLVLALTGSATKAGIVGFANWIPWVLFGLPAGALVDRLDRKRTMIVCDGLRALALTSIVVALPLGWLRFWQIVIVAFVERALSIFFESAETVALSRIVPRNASPRRSREMTRASTPPPCSARRSAVCSSASHG